MTVGELIEKLKDYHENLNIAVWVPDWDGKLIERFKAEGLYADSNNLYIEFDVKEFGGDS
jgi:hypothetical protein